MIPDIYDYDDVTIYDYSMGKGEASSFTLTVQPGKETHVILPFSSLETFANPFTMSRLKLSLEDGSTAPVETHPINVGGFRMILTGAEKVDVLCVVDPTPDTEPKHT